MPLQLRAQVAGVPGAVQDLGRGADALPLELAAPRLRREVQVARLGLTVIAVAVEVPGLARVRGQVEAGGAGAGQVHGEAAGPGGADAARLVDASGGRAERGREELGEEEGAEAVCGYLELVALGGFGVGGGDPAGGY